MRLPFCVACGQNDLSRLGDYPISLPGRTDWLDDENVVTPCDECIAKTAWAPPPTGYGRPAQERPRPFERFALWIIITLIALALLNLFLRGTR